MLYLTNLTKNYGKMRAVDNLTLHVPKGDLFGFVGPNGAGKTTTIRMSCGLLRPTSGSIIIGDTELEKNEEMLKRKIGYVPDFFGVYDNFKVTEYMNFYGSIYGLTDDEMKKITPDLLELVNLSDKGEFYVDNLSRGMKQRLCVARALIHNPELLILDEPSSGLDPGARVEMKELLMNLSSMGKTIIISSHILPDIAEMCSSVGIMMKGRLVAAGKIEDLLNMGQSTHDLIIEIKNDMELAVGILREFPNIEFKSVKQNEIVIRCSGMDEEINAMVLRLIQGGVLIGGFHKEERSLEKIFMELTRGGAQ